MKGGKDYNRINLYFKKGNPLHDITYKILCEAPHKTDYIVQAVLRFNEKNSNNVNELDEEKIAKCVKIAIDEFFLNSGLLEKLSDLKVNTVDKSICSAAKDSKRTEPSDISVNDPLEADSAIKLLSNFQKAFETDDSDD